LLVLGLVGLWHGASWKFLAWGLANGVLIAVQQSWRFLSPAARARAPASLWSLRGFCGWLFTVSAGMVVIIPFFAADFSDCGDYLSRMLGGAGAWSLSRESLGILCGIACLFAIHAAAASVDLARLWERIGAVGRTLSFVVLVFLLWRLRVDDPAAFIYFQF
jgi:D-alanyl-lipoteichoic acid acyltransferase DltB (MBOAT superfamily)